MNIVTRFVLLCVSALMFGSCKEDPASADPVNGRLTLSSEYTSTVLPKSGSITAVDSLRITRARFSIRDIRFKSTGEDSLNFRSVPTVLELNLAGTAQTVGVADVPFGTYQRIDFDVHRVEASELTGRSDSASFADFLKDERYSVIISGVKYRGGKDTTFTYRSKIDVRQKLQFDPPFIVSKENNSVTTVLQVSSAGWFRFNGTLLDPTDKNNEGKIDENIKASFKAKKKS